jgi:hypothetical protein
LRQAQLETLERLRWQADGEQFVDPYYWSGFVCVGDVSPLGASPFTIRK